MVALVHVPLDKLKTQDLKTRLYAHSNVDVSVVCPVSDFFSLLPCDVPSLQKYQL